MSQKLRALVRLLPIFIVMSVLGTIVMAGCGRSDLLADALVLDGGTVHPDGGGTCSPATCPLGCCDGTGTCRVGTDVQECGDLGGTCSDCLGLGFTGCDTTTHACVKSTTVCDINSCPLGCCISDASGAQFCVGGTDDAQCGASGVSCADCTQIGDVCDSNARTCAPSGCNAASCGDGCCVGNVCLHGGDDDVACGSGGMACDDCASRGQKCGNSDAGAPVCVGTAACGPGNCKGCCIGDVCVTGSDNTACGLAGTQCANCAGKGEACGAGGICQVPTCNAANCAGCCQGNACVLMTSDEACGKGGAACAACGATQTCNSGTCVSAPACGPATCPTGCCSNGVCAQGTQATVCGNGGGTCQNCSIQGLTCTGQACVKPVCGPGNCAGCCSNGVCVAGSQDTICGTAGAACTDCTGIGDVCGPGGVCKVPCGPANCAAGCCSGQTCVGGFLNDRCGSAGAACTDCTATGATCDTAAIPRVCSAPNTCPSKYAGCAAGVTTPVLPTHQTACSDADLQDAAAGCTGGLASAMCQSFLVFIAGHPACASCLAPFEHDFNTGDFGAVYSCATPFDSAACNHQSGCEVDCVTQSCAMCAPGDVSACQTAVEGNAAQCGAFVTAADTCVGQAIALPPADACDPFSPTYTNGNTQDFGLYLQGMGQLFCQP